MLPTREELLEKVAALTEPPVAIEAYWEGESSGWFVVLSAVVRTPTGYRDTGNWALQGSGGDLRLFNGQAPPWPEAQLAQQVGAEVAVKFGVPFYFASPNHPEEDCPRWWEQDQGYPCSRCGIPLLQRQEPCPWRGTCYDCYQAKQREQNDGRATSQE